MHILEAKDSKALAGRVSRVCPYVAALSCPLQLLSSLRLLLRSLLLDWSAHMLTAVLAVFQWHSLM